MATGGGQGEAQMERLVSVRKQCTTAEKLCAVESGGGARQTNMPPFSQEAAEEWGMQGPSD